nr:aminotransferase class V-fold PLP-dependent enzyme [Angustibacter aerolatus]
MPTSAWSAAPGYLNAATLGLPPRSAVAALQQAVLDWQRGAAGPVAYDDEVQRARALFGRLCGVGPDAVAVGSQASVVAGAVAASLPDGADVVCVDGDFGSVVYPFLVQAHRGVRVRHAPLEALADEVARGTDLVAYSLAQSADGRVADAAAVREAAGRVGAMTFCDTTQAAGWLDVDAAADDVTVCSAYKWLCCPRGAAFSTYSPRALAAVRPVNAGWYAGESVWGSCYGPDMQAAHDARRHDVSPAWLAWVGTVPALQTLLDLPPGLARRHGTGLADRLLAALDLPPADRPVVALDDPAGSRATALEAAGVSVAGRAGRVRIAFHLWNTEADVELAVGALRAAGRGSGRAPSPSRADRDLSPLGL